MPLSWAAERFAFLVSRRDRAPERRKVGGSTPPLTTRSDQAIRLLTCGDVNCGRARPPPQDARPRPLGPLFGTLTLHAEAADEENLRRIQDLITARLERFGQRDHLKVDWQQRRNDSGRTPDVPTSPQGR